MKTESIVRPEKLIVNYYDKYEKCIVTFNTNIQEEQRPKPDTEETETIYVYDTYTIKTWFRKTLKSDIEADYEKWLEFAKQQEYDEYAKIVRAERDKLLQESDKQLLLDRLGLQLPDEITATTLLTVFKDFIGGLKNILNGAWAKYRQELRDIPQQPGFPYEVEFPEKPKTDKEEE